MMLREIREQLAGRESGLIETARGQGASWADLAGPLGVASRQAAERRYLRLRPGKVGSTGEERVQTTRDSGPPNAPSPPGPATTPQTCAASPDRSPPSPTCPPAPRTRSAS